MSKNRDGKLLDFKVYVNCHFACALKAYTLSSAKHAAKKRFAGVVSVLREELR